MIMVVFRHCLHAFPQPERDAAEVALHDADHGVLVLSAGAATAVYNSGQARQQGRQGAAAAQQLQPLLAQVNLVLQRRKCTPALRQHGPQDHRPLHNMSRHAAAPEHDKSGRGGEKRQQAVAEQGDTRLQR